MSLRSRVRAAWFTLPRKRRRALMTSSVARFLYRNVWARPGHFYSPYPDLKRFRVGENALPDLGRASLPVVELREEEQLALLNDLLPFYESGITSAAVPGFRYRLDNWPFGWGDGLAYAMLLRHIAPARYVEVGSGWSSLLALDVKDHWLPDLDLTFIDPYPEQLAKQHADFRLIKAPVQDVDSSVFSALSSNDVLFIDTTHVAKVGSDVNYLLFKVLPQLASGVIVHLHDIQWPFEYPPEWTLQGRAWNETYLLHAFLEFNSRFEILLWPSFLIANHRGWFEAHARVFLNNPGGSIWLRTLD